MREPTIGDSRSIQPEPIQPRNGGQVLECRIGDVRIVQHDSSQLLKPGQLFDTFVSNRANVEPERLKAGERCEVYKVRGRDPAGVKLQVLQAPNRREVA